MLPTHPNTQPLVVTAVTLVLLLLLFSSFPDVYRITDRHVLDPTPTCPISPLVESIYAHDVAPRVASVSTPSRSRAPFPSMSTKATNSPWGPRCRVPASPSACMPRI